jgi:hypothetical protein
MATSLPVLNLDEATFECTFGRGCDGHCCRNGRPGIYPEDRERIEANLEKFLPRMRPEARELVEEEGFLTRRLRGGLPMLRVVGGWCVFFNAGCVLHGAGEAEGDKLAYKPAACALFPLARTAAGDWYIRQWGFEGEPWDLFCLDPQASRVPAAESLGDEIRLAERYTHEEAGG